MATAAGLHETCLKDKWGSSHTNDSIKNDRDKIFSYEEFLGW